jgi:hypothetical protein
MSKSRKQGKSKGNRKNWVKNFKRLKQNEEVLKGLKVQS